ncbi:MAG: YdjY domain-containing protein [Lentisphaeria bacterium]
MRKVINGKFPAFMTALAVIGSLGLQVRGQEVAENEGSANKARPKAPFMEIKRLPNGDIVLGKITLHREARELSFPAEVNQKGGGLEVVIAQPDGRLHESLLRADVSGFRLQTMLLLLGLNNGSRRPDEEVHQGDLVDLDIQWKNEAGEKVREPVENFIFNRTEGRIMKRIGWVFVGSEIRDEMFMADAEGNLVIIYSVGSTVLDIPGKAGLDDTMFVAYKEKKEPQVGAAVTVFITPRRQVKAK